MEKKTDFLDRRANWLKSLSHIHIPNEYSHFLKNFYFKHNVSSWASNVLVTHHNLNWRAVSWQDGTLSSFTSSSNWGIPHCSVSCVGAKRACQICQFLYDPSHGASLWTGIFQCANIFFFSFREKESPWTSEKFVLNSHCPRTTLRLRDTSVNGLTEKQSKRQVFISSRRKLPRHFCSFITLL